MIKRPFASHLCILGCLAAFGTALFFLEVLFPKSHGWLIKTFTLTKLYWLCLMAYTLVSTLAVLSVKHVRNRRSRPLTAAAVLLTHVAIIVMVWLTIGLGVHDRVEIFLHGKTGSHERTANEHVQKKRPQPPSPQRKTQKTYHQGEEAVQKEVQTHQINE